MGTPPWWTDAWDLRGDLAKIEQQWAPTRGVLDDPALFDVKDADVSAWSCGEHAGHIVLVAQNIAGRIERNLAEPERHRDETTEEVARALLSRGGFTRGRATAPTEMRPDGKERQDFLGLLSTTVESWGRIRARADELPGCAARSRHFALGYLTSTEWVRMCAVHTAHHLKLVRDIAGEEALASLETGSPS